MRFSLIVATLGRKQEISNFLSSLLRLDYDLSELEVILVDQNQYGFLTDIISCFNGLNIVHLNSARKGLSYNRNLGIKLAKGEIICFPDDDCEFYSDTLKQVDNAFEANIDFCLGRIFDRSLNSNVIKAWPNYSKKITPFASYFLSSSITLFVSNSCLIFFDEKMGVGAQYGSCEDADYIYRLASSGARGWYLPIVEVWHPMPNTIEVSLDKVFSYASGFGYFVSSNFDKVKIIFLFLLIGKKSFQFVANLFFVKFRRGYFKAYISGLRHGLRS